MIFGHMELPCCILVFYLNTQVDGKFVIVKTKWKITCLVLKGSPTNQEIMYAYNLSLACMIMSITSVS